MSGRLRSANELLAPAVADTIAELDVAQVDAGAVRLAQQYAAMVDAAAPDDRMTVLEKIGPKLLAALESLGATPRARAALRKGGESSGGGSSLAALRAARGA